MPDLAVERGACGVYTGEHGVCRPRQVRRVVEGEGLAERAGLGRHDACRVEEELDDVRVALDGEAAKLPDLVIGEIDRLACIPTIRAFSFDRHVHVLDAVHAERVRSVGKEDARVVFVGLLRCRAVEVRAGSDQQGTIG